MKHERGRKEKKKAFVTDVVNDSLISNIGVEWQIFMFISFDL